MPKYKCTVQFSTSRMVYETIDTKVEIDADSEEEAKQFAIECDPPDEIDLDSEVDEIEVISIEEIEDVAV